MKKVMAVYGVLSFVVLSGCSEEVKTRAWYMEHPKELAEVFAKCKASGNDTPNCRNAIEAQFRIKQANAPIPTFGPDTAEMDKAQVFKSYEMTNWNESYTYSFPNSLKGKTIQDIKDGNYSLTDDEKNKLGQFCKSLDNVLVQIKGEAGLGKRNSLEYACKQFKF